MGIHLRVLNKSYPMNTNKAGFKWFKWFSKNCATDESILSVERVKVKSIDLIPINELLCSKCIA